MTGENQTAKAILEMRKHDPAFDIQELPHEIEVSFYLSYFFLGSV